MPLTVGDEQVANELPMERTNRGRSRTKRDRGEVLR